ncbi:hypothetical protein GA0115243_11061, partial [Streptomyces sp. ScaeMP-e83]
MPREQPGPTADGNGSTRATDHRHHGRTRLTAVRRWIATAPGTYSWLAVLLVTTVVLHR